MEMLDRYLQAVRKWLPSGQQDDILAELAEDLRSQMEDREAELGRPLKDADVAEILKRRGHPAQVACGYLPKRQLIGPAWFPVYLFVLKLVLLWVLVPTFLFVVAPIVYLASSDPGSAVPEALSKLPMAALTAFGVITLVFAALDRVQLHDISMDKWDPRRLPAVRVESSTKMRCIAYSEIISCAILAPAWAYVIWFHGGFELNDGLRVAFAPIWYTFAGPLLLAILLGGLAVGIITLLRPSAKRLRLILKLALNLASLVGVAILLGAGTLVELSSTTLSGAALATAEKWTNTGVTFTALFVGATMIFDSLQEIYRYLKKTSFKLSTLMWLWR